MSDLGLGVMIQMLGGNEKTVKAIQSSLGKEITGLELDSGNPDDLLFTFTDSTAMKVWDGGQSCCEDRFMHTDDVLSDFVGATLISIEVRDAPNVEDAGDVHEVQFLVVTTSKGAFTVETHNEHNGYYGGFWIEAEVSQQIEQ